MGIFSSNPQSPPGCRFAPSDSRSKLSLTSPVEKNWSTTESRRWPFAISKWRATLEMTSNRPRPPCKHYTTAPGPLQTVLAVWPQIRAWFLQNQVEVAKLLLLNGSIVKSCEIPTKKKPGFQNVYHYDICLWMAFCRVLENCWTLAQWLSALSIERKMEGSHLSIFWQLGGRHQVANPSGFEIQSDLRKSSCLCLWRSST